MYLTEQHIITVNDKRYKDLDRICFLSKNLYNAALYIIKQEFLVSGKWIRSTELNKKMVAENNVDFRAMSGSSSQQILMALDKNLKSYFSAIKAWKRDNKKFTGCPKFPKYKHKTKGRNIFTYSYVQFKHRGEYIYFPKKEGLQPLKTRCKEGTVKQIRFVPKADCYVIELVLHKASKEIVSMCLKDNITTLIVGHNDGWKQEVDMGKRNNQNFVSIPFETFISMLRYKSERQGLRFVEINESHTSKCSSLDLEEVKHHDSYIGKRVKRGLFRTKNGILLNADINGAYNIMRKVKGDAAMPPYRGFGYNPVKKFINK